MKPPLAAAAVVSAVVAAAQAEHDRCARCTCGELDVIHEFRTKTATSGERGRCSRHGCGCERFTPADGRNRP